MSDAMTLAFPVMYGRTRVDPNTVVATRTNAQNTATISQCCRRETGIR